MKAHTVAETSTPVNPSILFGHRHAVERELVELVVDRTTCRTLETSIQRGPLTRLVTGCVRLVYSAVESQQLPPRDGAGMVEIGSAAASVARSGVGIDTVLAACSSAHRYLTMRAGAAGSTRFTLGLYAALLEEIAAGYAEQCRATAEGFESPTAALIHALLNGGDADDIRARARDARTILPEFYDVMALHWDRPGTGFDSDFDTDVEVRVAAELESAFPSVSASLGPAGGILLVPVDRDSRTTTSVTRVVRAVSGSDVTTVFDRSTPHDVADTAELVSRALLVVRRLHYPVGTYPVEALALETQMLRDGPARDALARIVAPLADRPELMDVLRLLSTEKLARKQLARQLFVHPNTLGNRLQSISRLTGLDTSRSSELRRLGFASMAWDYGRFSRESTILSHDVDEEGHRIPAAPSRPEPTRRSSSGVDRRGHRTDLGEQ